MVNSTVTNATGVSQEAVTVHQRTWLDERRQKLTRLNGSTPLLSQAATPAAMDGVSAGSTGTTPHTLLQTVLVEDEVAITTSLSATGVDINDKAKVQAALKQPVKTVGDVLKLVNAYHKQVIRPEVMHLAIQVESCMLQLDDRVNYVSSNLNWLTADHRKEQRQRASIMLLLNGFPRDWPPDGCEPSGRFGQKRLS